MTSLAMWKCLRQRLGLPAVFRGLDIVKILVEKGATFDFPLTEETEIIYHCYIGQKYANYRTNYSLYLLKVFRGELKGACCLKGMKFTKNAKREVGKSLLFLADEERITVLNYFIAQKEKISFQPEEMLFYAILQRIKSFMKNSENRVLRFLTDVFIQLQKGALLQMDIGMNLAL